MKMANFCVTLILKMLTYLEYAPLFRISQALNFIHFDNFSFGLKKMAKFCVTLILKIDILMSLRNLREFKEFNEFNEFNEFKVFP